jgi:hypothetical protein
VDHTAEVDRSFKETRTTTNRHRPGSPRQRIVEELLWWHERDAELVETTTNVLVHQVFRAYVSSWSFVFPGHPQVVPWMPTFVVLRGAHIFIEPPAEHFRRDSRHTGEYCDVKNAIGQSLNPAEIRQLLWR